MTRAVYGVGADLFNGALGGPTVSGTRLAGFEPATRGLEDSKHY